MTQHVSNEKTTPTKDEILEALKNVYDPEIPINIVDLGLVYGVEISEEGNVHVLVSLTAPTCPIGDYILEQVKEAVRSVPGVKEVSAELTFEPLWNLSMVSEDGKKMLRAMGFPL